MDIKLGYILYKYDTIIILSWGLCILINQQILSYKSIMGIMNIFTFILGPLMTVIFLVIPGKKGKSLSEKAEILYNRLVYGGIFIDAKWRLLGHHVRTIKKSEINDNQLLMLTSLVKVDIQEQNNPTWITIMYSLIISGLVSFTTLSLDNFFQDQKEEIQSSIEKGVISNLEIGLTDITGVIQYIDFDEFYLTKIISGLFGVVGIIIMIGLFSSYHYKKILIVQEAILLYENEIKLKRSI